MSPNRGAAIQAIATQQNNARSVFKIMSENIQLDLDDSIIADLLCCVGEVSTWETRNEPIHIHDVYQITPEMVDPANFLPGRWSQNVS